MNIFSKRIHRLCFVFLFTAIVSSITSHNVLAQDTAQLDQKTKNFKPIEPHSPHKATIYALILPGLGQAYNHKYWKIPVVYAALGGCIYLIHYNTKKYNELKVAYDYASVTAKVPIPPLWINIPPTLPEPPNDLAKYYSEAQLKSGLPSYRRDVELAYILTGAVYLLSIVDAVVDAHFFDYDINEDLTLNIKPWIPELGTNTAYKTSGGINLTLRF